MELCFNIIKGPQEKNTETTFSFFSEGGTIGRSEDASWKLNDFNKIISNHHLEIIYENNEYYFCDRSSNGTYYTKGSIKVPSHELIKLKNEERLTLGEYELQSSLRMSKNNQSKGLNKREIDVSLEDNILLDQNHDSAIDVILKKSSVEQDILEYIDIIPSDEDLFEDEDELNQSVLTEDISLPVFTKENEGKMINASTIRKDTNDSLLLNIFSKKLNIDISDLAKEEQIIHLTKYADMILVAQETIENLNLNMSSLKSQLAIGDDVKISKDFVAQCHDVKSFYNELNKVIDDVDTKLSKTFSPESLRGEYLKSANKNWLGQSKAKHYWECYAEEFSYLNENNQNHKSMIQHNILQTKKKRN